jgi:hypothetical protein
MKNTGYALFIFAAILAAGCNHPATEATTVPDGQTSSATSPSTADLAAANAYSDKLDELKAACEAAEKPASELAAKAGDEKDLEKARTMLAQSFRDIAKCEDDYIAKLTPIVVPNSMTYFAKALIDGKTKGAEFNRQMATALEAGDMEKYKSLVAQNSKLEEDMQKEMISAVTDSGFTVDKNNHFVKK